MAIKKSTIAELRYRCQTDLWFLCNDVLRPFNGNNFSEVPHKEMCEHYVKKDPSFKTFREFALAFSGSHDRMQLVPRQARKSGIKIIDNVQWIINYPEVRIMTLTSTNELSTAFINQLTDYFVVKGKAKRDPETNRLEGGDWTEFQTLFPEHCISETEVTQGEYITPLRNDPGSNFGVSVPTAATLSMEASSSGWRCDIMDCDDPVSDKNAENPNQLEKLRDRLDMIYELLMSYGFRHWVATRYHPHDPYGRILEACGIHKLYGDFEQEGFKLLARPCWWMKGEPYKQPDYKTWVPNAADVDLFYPEGAPFHVLKKKMKNMRIFSSQQLNDPVMASNVAFSETDIRGAIVDHTALPKEGITFASWDFAYGQADSTEDYSVGIIGLIDKQRRWWITDIVCDRFNFTEKCYQVVKAIKNFRPYRTCIEDTPGVKGAMDEPISRYARQEKVPLNIDWISTGQGVSDAKYLRICSLHPLITDHRLFFLNRITCMDELIEEFKNVRSKSKARNDIPDAIARLVQEYSKYAVEQRAPSQAESTRQFLELAENEFYNMMHRKGKYSEAGDWDQGKWSRDYVEPPPVENEVLDPDSPAYAIDQMFRPV